MSLPVWVARQLAQESPAAVEPDNIRFAACGATGRMAAAKPAERASFLSSMVMRMRALVQIQSDGDFGWVPPVE